VRNAQSLVDLVGNRVKAKTAPPADGLRVQAELAERRRQLFQAEESVRVVSAELVRLLRLDPTTVLMPAEEQALPLSFVNESASLAELIDQGAASRPEVAERQAVANATAQRWRQEQWRPLIPGVHVGLSAGGFGGGENAFLGNFRDRADFDALLVWQLQNFGFGNRALRRERAAQTQQATLATAEVRDLVAAEVAAAYHQVHFRRKQIDAARDQVQAAEKALPLNFLGIKGEVLRAIEAQQAIQALASARFQYLSAITDYNRAQFLLLRAVGQPLDPSKDRR
jgi:outer membrane protein TolC